MDTSNRSRLYTRVAALSSLVLFLVVVTVNALANILPINGVGTGQLSDELPNLFVPAGLTFSIWGLIYLLLAGYSTEVIVVAFGRKPSSAWTAADGWIFTLNMAANAGWIFAWQYRHVGISLALMLVILATLIWLEERNASRSSASSGEAVGAVARFWLSTPLNVYLGWICVATIANVTALLVKAGWNGFGLDPRAWTVALIAAGLAVGLLLSFLRKALAAPLVIVWAYAGIVIKRAQTDGSSTRIVWIAAAAAAVILLAAATARYVSLNRAKRA